jgi:hypothetical protein
MAEPGPPNTLTDDTTPPAVPPARTKDDVALELMKFIATATGYGKAGGGSAGFSGKPATHSPEEHASALLDLFARCRKVLGQG